MPDPIVTPGKDRVVLFTVNGNQFGFRRPSRADQTEAARRAAAALAPMSGYTAESALINGLDPVRDGALWDARLEVGLVPQRGSDGKPMSLGERAPAHWLDGDNRVAFGNVDPEEFEQVVEELTPMFKKKEETPTPTVPGPSGTTAASQTSG